MRRRLSHSAALVWLCLAFAMVSSASVNAHGRIKHSHDKGASPAVGRTIAVPASKAAEPATATPATPPAVTTADGATPTEIASTRDVRR